MKENKKNIFFLYGNNDFGISAFVKNYKKSFIKKEKGDIHDFDFSSKENRSEMEKKLYDSLQEVSLFSSVKMIVIRDLFSSKRSSKKEDCEDNNDFEKIFLDSLLKNKSDQIVFLEKHSLDKRSRAYKFFEKYYKDGLIEKKEFLIPLNFEFNSWLAEDIKNKGGKISREVVEFLSVVLGKGMEQKEKGVVIASYDLFQSSMEIDKLVSYCDGREITREDVSLLVSSSTDMNIFNLIESIGKRDKKKAIKILSGQIEKGLNENYILTMLVYHFRNLIVVKSLIEEGVNYDEVSKITKLHPFVVKKNVQYCSGLSLSYLNSVYGKLYEADTNIKSGNMNPQLVLDILVSAI